MEKKHRKFAKFQDQGFSVVPVHKKQARSSMRNYRPVSLLSVVSKVMEKVINTTLMNHLEKKRLLSQHQFGFRTGLSAADLLTHLSHQWLSCMNTGGAVRTLAVDIAGAFDKVSHLGVLHKLRSYGIAGTLHQWMTSYLTDRNLQAVVGGATSSRFPVTAGVPQGSILGPTLFLVYVNDAADVLPPGAVPATYADDTTLYVLIPSVNHAATSCNTLQTGMDALAEWGTTWRIQFEPSKSQAMTITRHRHQWPIPAASFGGLNVDETATIKLLGVVFDKSMSFRNHLRLVAMRAAQRLGFPAQGMPGSRHLWPAHGVQRVRQTPHGVQPPCMGWRSPPITCPNWTKSNVEPSPSSAREWSLTALHFAEL